MKNKILLNTLTSIGLIALSYVCFQFGMWFSADQQKASLSTTQESSYSFPSYSNANEETAKKEKNNNSTKPLRFINEFFINKEFTRKILFIGQFINDSKTIVYQNAIIKIDCLDETDYSIYSTRRKVNDLIESGITPYSTEIKIPISIIKSDIHSTKVTILSTEQLQ